MKLYSCYPTYRVFIKYCVLSKILKYNPDSLSVFPRCQCVYTVAGETQALAAELAELRKIKHFQGKTQSLVNTLYFSITKSSGKPHFLGA